MTGIPESMAQLITRPACPPSLESNRCRRCEAEIPAGRVLCDDCFEKAKQEEQERVGQEGLERKIQEDRQRLEASKIGKFLMDATFKNFRFYGSPVERAVQEQNLFYCRQFAENCEPDSGQWLTFTGTCGTGKGHLAAAIIKRVIERGKGPAIFKGCNRLLIEIRDSYDPRSRRRTVGLIDECTNVPLLVLDDLGMQFGTDHDRTMLYEIFEERKKNLRPMIVTTNRPLKRVKDLNLGQKDESLEAILGPQNLDRLLDVTTNNRVLVFKWPSFRSLVPGSIKP